MSSMPAEPIATRMLTVDPADPEPDAIAAAAGVLRAGGLVAFPTETVYGLGANALDAAAVERIYAAKGRAREDPCIVHIADIAELRRVTTVDPADLKPLTSAFWPGPLSLVLPRADAVPPIVTAGRPTVAVRMPAHPVALALIRAADLPVAAPSANTFMHTSPTTAEHVWDDLAGRIELILDGGPTSVGVESTVVDLTGPTPTVLRPGGVSLEDLLVVLGEVRQRPSGTPAVGDLASPGLFAKHYAPHADLLLLDGARGRVLAAIQRRAAELTAQGTPVGVLLTDEERRSLDLPAGVVVASLGSTSDVEGVARRLFAALRELEAAGVRVILAHTVEEAGIGRAIRDRLLRAAGGRLIRV
jgi:L-threonylcarbamoyladenylate synthase